MKKIQELINNSYDEKEANRYKSFITDKDALNLTVEIGREVLTLFPDIPGACVPMSSMWGALIRDNSNYPVHVVAGTLSIDNTLVFGEQSDKCNYKTLFKSSDLDWNGHCWIVFGNYICDISICRTAYSGRASSTLKNKIVSMFGEKGGLFLNTYSNLENTGFKYKEEYVLTDEEISKMFTAATFIMDRKK